jgi:DNA-directed RNA polymerase subunit RPC12/RpoP|tara:strand:+ start:308 stop:559 length:252 start_codon:yes stop_codon:yes gene_type:complete
MGKVLGMGGKDQPNAQVKLDINDLTDIVCENCGSKIFREATMFKKLSALLSPTGKEQVVPIPVYRCDECGHINDGFLPKITKK